MFSRILIGLILVVSMFGCKKYPPPPQALIDSPELCEDIEGFDINHTEKYYFFPKSRFYYSNAKFNPANEQQIFFLKFDSIERQRNPSELLSYHSISGYTYIVWKRQAGVQPVIKNYAPGPNGNILIESTTKEIYILSMTGGIAKKIVAKPVNGSAGLTNPSWNRDGSKFMVYLDRGFNKPGSTIIFSAEGQALDTIDNNLPNSTFSGTSNLYTAWDNNGTVFQYNVDFDKTVRSFQTPFKSATGMNIAVSPNGYEMIACDADYIYKINLIDSSKTAARSVCESKQYGMPNYSFNGNKILFTKQCFQHLKSDSILFSSSIHIMDKNCYHQDSIILPLR